MPQIIPDKAGRPAELIVVWSRDDIIEAFDLGEFEGDDLTEDQIDSVIRSLCDNFNAEHGITWSTIISEIGDLLEGEKPLC